MPLPISFFSRFHQIQNCPATLGLSMGLATVLLFETAALANPIILDGTTPGSQILGNCSSSNSCTINNPSFSGANGKHLLHSFQEFGVEQNATVLLDSSGVENTLVRVTGANPSDLRGILRLVGGENLFLINPNGISFHNGSILDISGSFTASTAESLLFENPLNLLSSPFVVTEYSAADTTSVFPSAVLSNITGISGLRFNGNHGNVEVTGTIQVLNGETPGLGRTLGLLGERVIFDNARLQLNDNSHLRLAAIDGPDVVLTTSTTDGLSFNFDSLSTFSRVDLLDSEIDLGSGLGLPVFQAVGESITFNNSKLRTLVSTGSGQPIELKAEDEIILDNSSIQSEVLNNLPGNSIELQASDIALSNASEIQAIARDNATSGSLKLQASNNLQVNGSSVLRTIADQNAQGGNLQLSINESVTLDGQSIIQATGNDDGAGGTVQIDTRELIASDASEIQAVVNGNRPGGGVIINASERVIVDQQSKILVVSNQDSPIGNLTLTTGILSLDSSEIAAFTSQKGGNVRLEASQQIQLNNGSLISATGDQTGGMQGGTITLITPTLEALSESDNDIRARAQLDPFAAPENIQFNSISLDGVLSIINFNQEPVVHSSVTDNIQNVLNQIDTPLPIIPSTTPTIISPAAPTVIQPTAPISTPATITPPETQTSVINNPNQPSASSQSSNSLPPTSFVLGERLQNDYNLVNRKTLGNRYCHGAADNSNFVITGRGGLVPSPHISLADDIPLEDLEPPESSLPPRVQPAAQVDTRLNISLSTLRLGMSVASLPAMEKREANHWQRNQQGQVELIAMAPHAGFSRLAVQTCSKTRR